MNDSYIGSEAQVIHAMAAHIVQSYRMIERYGLWEFHSLTEAKMACLSKRQREGKKPPVYSDSINYTLWENIFSTMVVLAYY